MCRLNFLKELQRPAKLPSEQALSLCEWCRKVKKKIHAIAAKTTGKAEETIIQQDNGILDLHRNAVYCGNGDKDYKLPHIKFEDKIIYILGYSSRDKWEMVLGAQFGCVYIDEINTADIEFIREMSTRNDYMLATLNPDDPSLLCIRSLSTAPVLLKNMKTMFLPRLRRSLPKNLYRIGGIGSFLCRQFKSYT